jgi:hypothetical protein
MMNRLEYEPRLVFRRPDCLSQAAMDKSVKNSRHYQSAENGARIYGIMNDSKDDVMDNTINKSELCF